MSNDSDGNGTDRTETVTALHPPSLQLAAVVGDTLAAVHVELAEVAERYFILALDLAIAKFPSAWTTHNEALLRGDHPALTVVLGEQGRPATACISVARMDSEGNKSLIAAFDPNFIENGPGR